MPLIKFKTDYSADSIKQVEVLRETDACVYVAGVRPLGGKSERREAKVSEFAQYHDTWADAHAYLMRKAEAVVKSARMKLEAANGRLGNIKGMKQPKNSQ